MHGNTGKWLTVCGALLCLTGAAAADEDRKEDKKKGLEGISRKAEEVARASFMCFASELQGFDILDPGSDDEVGEIKDLVLDVDSGRVLYVVVSHEAIDDRWITIPLNALRFKANQDGDGIESVAFRLASSQLKDAPGFAEDRWEQIHDPRFTRQVLEQDRRRRDQGTPYASTHLGHPKRMEEILGREVENARGEEVGEVEDALLNTASGNIEYLVVATGGFLGLGESHRAVPWRAMTHRGAEKPFVCHVERERLKNAPAFDGKQKSEFRDPAWIVGVHEYYGVVHPEGWRPVVKGSELLGYNVHNLQKEELGEIEDIAIDAENGRIAFAVLTHGGLLGIGSDRLPVPWRALTLDQKGENFSLDVTKKHLENAPQYGGEGWPETSYRTWAEKVHRFYGVEPQPVRLVSRIILLSELLGYDVQNYKEEDLGELEEVVLDVDTGSVAYAVLGYGGLLGLGEKRFALPWSKLGVRHGESFARLDANPKRFENAPGFDDENWPLMSRTEWIASLHKYYSVPPYWDSARTLREKSIRLPFSLEQGQTLRYRLKRQVMSASGSAVTASAADSSAGTAAAKAGASDDATTSGASHRGFHRRHVSSVTYRIAVKEVEGDGSARLSVTVENVRQRPNHVPESRASKKPTLHVQVGSDGAIESVETKPAADASEQALPSVGAVRSHLGCIFGAELRGQELRAGEVYTSGEREGRAGAVGALRLRYEGVNTQGSDSFASFAVLAMEGHPHSNKKSHGRDARNEISARSTPAGWKTSRP